MPSTSSELSHQHGCNSLAGCNVRRDCWFLCVYRAGLCYPSIGTLSRKMAIITVKTSQATTVEIVHAYNPSSCRQERPIHFLDDEFANCGGNCNHQRGYRCYRLRFIGEY